MEVKSSEDKKVTTNSRIKDNEIFKIKLALSSLTNTVVLCPMLATLYIQSSTDDETWAYFKRGVPGLILIHDSSQDIVAVQLFFADPESGFAIWRESLHQSSNYKASQRNFHTFKLSTESGGMAGIKFPTDEGGNIFLQDVLCSIPKGEPSSLPPKITSKYPKQLSIRRICKEEISSPCMFKHVTNVNIKPRSRGTSGGHKTKGTKHSGSGSSLDAADSDPHQRLPARRNSNVKNR